MRNLVLLQDSIFAGFEDEYGVDYPHIVSVCRDIGSSFIFALTQSGCLCSMEVSDTLRFESRISLVTDDLIDNSWFNATVVPEIGAVVCISHSGMIVSVKEDPVTGQQSETFEVEGDVEGGIATACWNPDASNIIIVTNNDSILLMTSYWDVLEEIPLPSRMVGSPCSVSWRGDGEFLTILTVDKEDSIPHVRVYSKKLELISIGRNVAEGSAGILKGLGSAVAYATNGSLIALSQQKAKSKPQIVFIEKNGFRHLEFDIQCPPPLDGSDDWKVTSLHWDLPSTLLAVGLSTIDRINGHCTGVVQLYYRDNYHWYLKQQWIESSLECLGFDTETVGRLFMVQSRLNNKTEDDNDSETISEKINKISMKNVLRIVDISWDVCVSNTSDGSISVIDGAIINLTPLGINTVPPPMSMYKHICPSPVRHVFFWPRNSIENNKITPTWGLVCLCDGDIVQYVLSSSTGMPVKSVTIDIKNIIDLLNLKNERRIIFRGIAATEVQPYNYLNNFIGKEKDENNDIDERILSIVLYGSKEMKHMSKIYSSYVYDNLEKSSGQGDVLLTLIVRLRDGMLLKSELNSHLNKQRNSEIKNDVNNNQDQNNNCNEMNGSNDSNSYNDVLSRYDPDHILDCDKVKSRVSRIALWPGDSSSLAVSTITGIDTFDVHRVRVTRKLDKKICDFFENDTNMKVIEGLHISNNGTEIDNAINDINLKCQHVMLENDYSSENDHNTDYVSIPPETCVQIAVIPKERKIENGNESKFTVDNNNFHMSNDDKIRKNDMENIMNNDLVIGLSARGKLYSGETLLVAGVSSFAVNIPLEVLMYVSTGTRPLLHFCSFKALRTLDPLKGEAWEDQQQAAAMAGAEPRPVERGARLLISAPGSPKVVLQMPRGNLEAFEPRPLIFLKAKELIDSNLIFSCLLLLRRQKVDLNYLIDYNPIKFLSQINDLVKESLDKNPELLSLLISSLEPGDTTISKYPSHRPTGADVKYRENQLPQIDFYVGSNKVNTICTAVRDSLLIFLNGIQGPRFLTALNPALCTYAKQNPPLLVAALSLIRGESQESSQQPPIVPIPGISKIPTQQLSSSKVQNGIKYLAFLADGSALFEAALGCCDFEMARTVAGQCQMDPKAYLPLLKGFEDLGIVSPRSFVNDNTIIKNEIQWQTAHMRFTVAVHLKQFEDAFEWAIKMFRAVWCTSFYPSSTNSSSSSSSSSSSFSISTDEPLTSIPSQNAEEVLDGKDQLLLVIKETFRIVTKKDASIYEFALPKMHSFIKEIKSDQHMVIDTRCVNNVRWVVSTCRELLSDIRVSYGAYCLKKLLYTEAVAAYLCAEPPRAVEAVNAARLMGDWQLALMIAGRYSGPGTTKTGISTGSGEGRENPVSGIVDDITVGDDGNKGYLKSGFDNDCNSNVENNELDPRRIANEIVSAFKESLEQGESGIFDDIAGGEQVGFGSDNSIEVTSKKALEAAQISVAYCNDVESAVAILLLSSEWMAAAEMALRTNRRDLLIEEIAPAVRVAAKNLILALPIRSARQAVLVAELSVLWMNPNLRLTQVASTEPTLVAELNGGTLNPDGTVWKDKDEDDTKSEFTVISKQSGASYISSASRTSVRSSASSSVSILSNLSIGSTGGRSTASTSAFSIGGLDHALLSRGTVTGPGGSDIMEGKREPLRKYKRRQRKIGKGEGGRDLWGLRREAAVCAELWSIGQVASIARIGKNICDILSLFCHGNNKDINLACDLQNSIDIYVKELQQNPPVVAPMYPPQWMEMRLMKAVGRYQEELSPNPYISKNIFISNQSNNNNNGINYKGDDDNDEKIENNLVELAHQLYYSINQEKKQINATYNWWHTAAEGILLWQSYRRVILES